MNFSLKPLVAEFIGTFALVFIGVLAVQAVDIVQSPNGLRSLSSIGLAVGLTVSVMVASLGAVSGGHFNPAVTAAFVATGRMNPVLGALYAVAQISGSMAAGALVYGLFSKQVIGAGTPALAPQVTPTTGVILEAIVTFLLVLVTFGTATNERSTKFTYPFAIGLTYTIGVIAIQPLTGGAINPARTFGPALASGMWANHIVYWVGPIVGGVLAGLIQNFVFMERNLAEENSAEKK